MARPYARMGALDSQALFDKGAHDARRHINNNKGGVAYYSATSAPADESVLEHELLMSRVKGGREGDKNARVFSSLNGAGADIGITPDMNDDEARAILRDNYRYAGVAVTDFIRQTAAYGPDEGSAFAVTHGGVNSIFSPVTALRPGQLVAMDFPKKSETNSMRRRRGVPSNKVTAVPRAYHPYQTAKTAMKSWRASIDKASTMSDRALPTYNKWSKFGKRVTDSYVMAAVAAFDKMDAMNTKDKNELAKQMGCYGEAPTTAGGAARDAIMSALTGGIKDKFGKDAAFAAEGAFGAMADAIDEDRSFIIGKCVQGCKKDGVATVMLGLTQ